MGRPEYRLWISPVIRIGMGQIQVMIANRPDANEQLLPLRDSWNDSNSIIYHCQGSL